MQALISTHGALAMLYVPTVTFAFCLIHACFLRRTFQPLSPLCMRISSFKSQFIVLHVSPRPTPFIIIPVSLFCNEFVALGELYPFARSMTTLFGLSNFQVVDDGQHDIDFSH